MADVAHTTTRYAGPNTGGFCVVIPVTPTIDTALYATGDAVGGLLEFASAARVAGGSGTIQAVTLVDKDKENVAFDLVLFNQTFTATADQAPFDPSDADLLNRVGVIQITAADYSSFANNSLATVKNVGLPFTCGTRTSASLFGQLVVRGGPTYTSTSDLNIGLHILQD